MIIDRRKVERIAIVEKTDCLHELLRVVNWRMRHNAYVTNRKLMWIMRYAANLSISKNQQKKSLKKSSLSLEKSVYAHVFTRHGC